MVDTPYKYWHVDKTVNIAMIAVMVVQLIGIVLWYSDVNHRLTNIKTILNQNSSQEKRIIQLETKFDYIKDALGSIETKLDKAKTALDNSEVK